MDAPSIAIVGSGPSGCFLAQALRRALPAATIDVIDRLPVPFGLVRYGVAPDHQGTKAVTRQFERLFERENVGFWGGIEIGRTLSLDELRACFDIVVLAIGLSGDRSLGIPGEALPGVVGSGRMTRWINDHPDEADYRPPLGARVLIVGNGNVALDLARLFAKSPREFEASDLSADRLSRITAAGVTAITVVGRGLPSAARFDTALLKELSKLEDTHVRVEFPPGATVPGDGTPGAAQQAALAALDGTGADRQRATRVMTFRFCLTPTEIVGTERLERVRFRSTHPSQESLEIKADTLITAVGFEPHPASALAGGSDGVPGVIEKDPLLGEGLFAAGWFRRGPRGTIPDNRADAKLVADTIVRAVADLNRRRPGRAKFAERAARLGAFDYAAWTAIRNLESHNAPTGRVRLKCATLDAMRDAARQARGDRRP